MNYEEIEIDGEKYKKVNNQWVDSSFIIAPTCVSKQIIKKQFEKIDFDSTTFWQMQNFIEETKQAECWDTCLELTDRYLKRLFVAGDLKTISFYLSVKTSCLRKLNKPDEVIKLCKEIKQRYGNEILSIATLTSLAAAYCDIEDWAKARQTCNYAYKKQGGGVGYTNELSLVYKRIEASGK